MLYIASIAITATLLDQMYDVDHFHRAAGFPNGNIVYAFGNKAATRCRRISTSNIHGRIHQALDFKWKN